MNLVKKLLILMRSVLGRIYDKIVVSRQRVPLQIHDLVMTGATFETSPHNLMDQFLKGRHRSPSMAAGSLYPKFFDTNPSTLELLEALVIELKPEVVVESGVANGASTRRILAALAKQSPAHGTLISCDIDSRVATNELLSNSMFEFVHIAAKADFSRLVSRLEKIDLFYHDSDHSYAHQFFEYSTVWEKLSEGGVLISDDINWSYAFLDFCLKVERVPYVLADTQKFSGFIRK